MDKHNDHIRNVLHGFFLSIGTTIAEPSTILPLIVNYLGGNSIVVGLFASLLRGGAIIVQLFAAFQAQEYSKMLPYLKRVFLIRFLAWFGIGLSIILWGDFLFSLLVQVLVLFTLKRSSLKFLLINFEAKQWLTGSFSLPLEDLSADPLQQLFSISLTLHTVSGTFLL